MFLVLRMVVKVESTITAHLVLVRTTHSNLIYFTVIVPVIWNFDQLQYVQNLCCFNLSLKGRRCRGKGNCYLIFAYVYVSILSPCLIQC